MCWQYPAKLGTPRLCGTTPPLAPDLWVRFGVALAFGLGLAGGGTLAAGETAARCFLRAEGDEDGDGAVGLAELLAGDGELGAGPAWKPRLEAAPLPGATSTNAATMMPTRTSGPTPNISTFISVLRLLPQRTVRPADLAGVAAASGRRRRTPRRAGVAGVAKGPAVGCPPGPAGYQPTVALSSNSGAGGGEAGAAGVVGGGVGAAAAGSGDAGGSADGAPKLGGIPPGLAWTLKPPACWSGVERPSLSLTMASSSPGVPQCIS
jgi:hypothetical protein